MNATLARKLRFSDAVYAINTTPKALRNWLARDLVKIHTPRQDAGWTEYSFLDIAILALVRTLVNFGVDVSSASDIANGVIADLVPTKMLRLKNPETMPAGALAILWTNQRVYVFQEGAEWKWLHATLYDTQLNPDTPLLPSSLAALRCELEPAPIFISIDVEAVLRTAFDRVVESVTEGEEDDEAELVDRRGARSGS